MFRVEGGLGRIRLYGLISLFALLQLADVLTTNRALARPGIGEGNPIEAVTMAHLGAAWWVPKLLLVAVAFLTAPKVRTAWPYYFAVAFYLYIVAGNISLM